MSDDAIERLIKLWFSHYATSFSSISVPLFAELNSTCRLGLQDISQLRTERMLVYFS